MIAFLFKVMVVGFLIIGGLFFLAGCVWVSRARGARVRGCTCPWNWFWGYTRKVDCPVHGRHA